MLSFSPLSSAITTDRYDNIHRSIRSIRCKSDASIFAVSLRISDRVTSRRGSSSFLSSLPRPDTAKRFLFPLPPCPPSLSPALDDEVLWWLDKPPRWRVANRPARSPQVERCRKSWLGKWVPPHRVKIDSDYVTISWEVPTLIYLRV